MNTIIIDGLSFALPLFIMAIGGIYCERSGVTNLAIEGLQGFGAFCGALFAVCIAPYFAGDSPVPFIWQWYLPFWEVRSFPCFTRCSASALRRTRS